MGLLVLVLLLGERIDPAERLAAALEPDELHLQLLAPALDRLGARGGQASPGLGRLRLQPRQLHLDRRRALAGRRRRVAEVGLGGAQSTELGRELAGAARLAPRLAFERSLEPARGSTRRVEHCAKSLRERDEPRVGVPNAWLGRGGARREVARLGVQPPELRLELEL